MIPQQKVLILSFLELESLRAWHYHAYLSQKDIEKKVNSTEKSQDAKKIAPILFLFYEESVCPLLLNYNKVHLASSLTCQT